MNYRVTWEIDVEAETPLEAAQKAFAYMQGSDTTATVFSCKPDKGKAVTVDLLERKI